MFTNGECGMWMNSSAYYGSIVKQANFEFGQTMLPLDTSLASAPQNSIIGGATLWALQGHEAEEYKGLVKVSDLSILFRRAIVVASRNRVCTYNICRWRFI
jgi:hypothetical protein